MKIINLSYIAELNKSFIDESFPCKIHMHDVCVGQYFTIDTDKELVSPAFDKIKAFFKSKNVEIVIDENELCFMPK